MENSGRIAVRKNQAAGSTLPEIGKIKIGEKKLSSKGVEYPSAIDYFKPTGNFATQFTSIYGDKPKILSIAFISDNLAEVCNERYECWTDGKRHGYGDGNTFTIWDGKKYIDDVPASDPRVTALKWDMMLTLRFVLLEMKGILGYWTFQTKAKATTIPSVIKAFDFVRTRSGTIVGFPFSLMVEKKKGYNPGEARNYPVVSLVPNFSETAMEHVNAYLEAGGNMNKITTNFIKAQEIAPESHQIEAPKITVEPASSPTLFEGRVGNDAL